MSFKMRLQALNSVLSTVMLHQSYTSVTGQVIDFIARVHEYTKKTLSRARARNTYTHKQGYHVRVMLRVLVYSALFIIMLRCTLTCNKAYSTCTHCTY